MQRDKESQAVRITKVLSLSAIFLLTPISAMATVIDFEGVAAAGTVMQVGQNYVEDGYNLFNPGGATNAVVVSQSTGNNTSGSDFYGWNNIAENNPVTLTNIAGDPFNFISLDVGSIFSPNPVSFDIIGRLVGGGTVTESIVNVGAFVSVTLGWTNLTSVDFNYASGEFPAIDNLLLSSSVPEPTILILLSLGLVGLGWRRKKSVSLLA